MFSLLLAHSSVGTLTLNVYNNTALAGRPISSSLIPNASFSLPSSVPWSAEVVGTLRAREGFAYTAQCSFGGATLAFLHVDDHLLCQQGANAVQTMEPNDGPLPTMHRTQLPIRLAVMHAGGSASNAADIAIAVAIAEERVALPTRTPPPPSYSEWHGRNVDTPSHDIASNESVRGTVSSCSAACDAIALCIGFVRSIRDAPSDFAPCYLRRLAAAGQTCASQFSGATSSYSTWTSDAKCGAKPAPIAATFVPTLPTLEVQRRAMQRSKRAGWGLWYDMSHTKHVHLPSGAALTLALCLVGGNADPNASSCVVETRIDWPPRLSESLPHELRLGRMATDRTYGSMYLASMGCNVSITFGGGDDLSLLLEVVDGGGNCDAFALVPVASSAWFRVAPVEMKRGDAGLAWHPYGLAPIALRVSAMGNASLPLVLPSSIAKLPHLDPIALKGRTSKIALCTSSAAPCTVEVLSARLANAKAADDASFAMFPSANLETAKAVQAAVLWTNIYNPLEYGPLSPVIRGNPWGLDKKPANDDWAYVIFDWDNHFGAYMLSLFDKVCVTRSERA